MKKSHECEIFGVGEVNYRYYEVENPGVVTYWKYLSIGVLTIRITGWKYASLSPYT